MGPRVLGCIGRGGIEDCIAVIGHRRGSPDDEGWEIERLRAEVSGAAGQTEEAEAITRNESTGYVYILGSHFGGKAGPLQPKRGFVARFREADVGHVTEDPAMELAVSRRSFAIHRLINDALEESGLDLIPLGEQSHKALIAATIERGEEENREWAGLVREDDYPINIEGAAFRENGNLLLGLRFPTTVEGRPILVELAGIDRLFDQDDALPEVSGFWTAEAVGSDGEIAGVRDLALLRTESGEELHIVTGNVDSRDKQSVLIQDYPGGRGTVATHFRCVLPKTPTPAPSEPSSSASSPASRVSKEWPSPRRAVPSTSRTRTRACICALPDSWLAEASETTARRRLRGSRRRGFRGRP